MPAEAGMTICRGGGIASRDCRGRAGSSGTFRTHAASKRQYH